MRAVVSFANNPFYQEKMKRLQDSVESQGVTFIGYKSFEEIGSPTHSQVPYAFKPYAIQKAIDAGVTTLLWCDSPIVAIKDITPVFEHIERSGYLFFDNIGHPLGKWTNDKCLKYFGYSREEAMNIKQIMACCMGFDFKEADILVRFQEYKDLSNELYPGSWDNHRHDQTVMSFIINRSGFMDIENGHETYFIYTHFRQVFKVADSVCLESK